jgi:hypothetical protein
MNNKKIANLNKGLITSIEAQSIPDGASSNSLNWLTMGDHIELSRGMYLIGAEDETANGRKADGTIVKWKTQGKKIFYWDTGSMTDWAEIGSDILGDAADGEDVSFADYVTAAGNQVWFSSPNSSLYKILTANPGSLVDQYDASKNFKGKIKIGQNRMFLWGRTADKTGIYGSYIDTLTFTTVTAEVLGTGDNVLKTFAGTLAFKAAGAKRTCFAITATDGAESFTDDYCGNLTGSAGGTGTINYATGAISLTFNTAPGVVNITVTYQWEDATNNGIADFTKSATRAAGQGFIFRQDDGGGNAQMVLNYSNVEYCLHEFKTWELNIGNTDTDATNLIYRERAGIPNWRAACATGSGIYYIDDTDEKDTKIRLLTLASNSDKIIPIAKSNNLDLSNYLFDKSATIEWGDYILFSCRTKDSSFNNRVLIFNKAWKAWDIRDYRVSCFVIEDGVLLGGDSLSNNVYELFSGFDDDDALINNYWESKLDDQQISRLKKLKKFIISGLIAKDQILDIYFDLDNSGYTLVGQVEGDGPYVDVGQAISVGSLTIGNQTVGSGNEEIFAYKYVVEIKVNTDQYKEIKRKFVGSGLGFLSISEWEDKDIRIKRARLPRKYRS